MTQILPIRFQEHIQVSKFIKCYWNLPQTRPSIHIEMHVYLLVSRCINYIKNFKGAGSRRHIILLHFDL